MWRERFPGMLTNATDGGDGTPGRVVSAKQRMQISRVHRGKTISPQHRQALSRAALGKKLGPCPPERRAKITAALRGRTITLEHSNALHLGSQFKALMTNYRDRLTMPEMMMGMARLAARRSVCQRGTQVGAVVTNNDCTSVLAFGYNGPPRGLPHSCRADDPGNCGCAHAEQNCLVKSPYEGATQMFTTLAPCERCAAMIINSRIRVVYYADVYRDATGLELLNRAGITTIRLEYNL